MIQRIREVLLTQYMGAITIGFLAAQGFVTLIALAVQPVAIYLTNRNQPRDIFGRTRGPVAFPWESFIPLLVSAALYFVIVYLLVRWLYLSSSETIADKIEENTSGPAGDV